MKLAIGLLVFMGLVLISVGMTVIHQVHFSRELSRDIRVLLCKILCNENAQSEISHCKTLRSVDVSYNYAALLLVDVNKCIFEANDVYQTCKRDCEGR